MQAVILIGGKGTRLGDIVKERPKPLLDVSGKPFVVHLIDNLIRHGFEDILLLAGFKAGVVNDFFGPESGFAETRGVKVTVAVEPEPMGTGGALSFGKDLLADNFLLTNGDSFFDINYLDLIRPREGAGLGRLALRQVEDARRYGLVDLDGSVIEGFREKPKEPIAGTINGGIYYLNKSVIDLIPNEPCSLESDIFPKLTAERQLNGFIYPGFFIDIGIPEDLARADRDLGAVLQRPAVFLDRDNTLNYDAGYTHKIEDFRWIDGAPEQIKRLNDLGYLVFVVTNQAGVARGKYTEDSVHKLHNWMRQDLRRIGAHIDAFAYCPHHPEGTVPEYAKACNCRKPEPGLLLQLLEKWAIDKAGSIMIGDKQSDADAGMAAGLASIVCPTGGLGSTLDKFLAEQGHRQSA